MIGHLALLLSLQIAAPDTSHARCTGIVVAHSDAGDACLTLWTYMRYLNQRGLDSTFVDAFGRTKSVKRRQDIQNNKANLGIRGSIFDPRIRFSAFVWTANTSQGDVNQVAVGAFLFFLANDAFNIGAGAGSLPSTRTTQGTFPNWLRVDHRTIADEYFRGSYTTAIWVFGQPVTGLKYEVMLGNNLSGYGISATQLDAQINTYSAALWWMPTTKEFGPLEGFGDFEHHDKLATLLGVHFTQSREDAQSQPNQEAIENVQLRLSDGTNIFDAGVLADSAQIRRATYKMFAAEAGVKYRGMALEFEHFTRWLGNFKTVGIVPRTSFFDQGYQIQGSAMLYPKLVQTYVAGSKILGQFGHPWDIGAGINVFPFKQRHFRVNAQGLWLRRSPVGYSAVPFPLGGNGFVFSLDTELYF
jgi:hypothetical protein